MKFKHLSEIRQRLSPAFPLARNARFLITSDVPFSLKCERDVTGVVAFDEPIDTAGLVGIGLIIGGVYCLNVVSGMSAH